MRKKKDFFTNVLNSLKEILEKKPSFEKMEEEVRLMGFHIKPIQGNTTIISKIKNERLVEVLWTLGKIDILMEKNFHRLTKEQKAIILKSIEEIQKKFTLVANLPTDKYSFFKKNKEEEITPYLMLEVFRKNKIKRNIN